MCTMSMECPRRLEEGVEAPGAVLRGGWEPSSVNRWG